MGKLLLIWGDLDIDPIEYNVAPTFLQTHCKDDLFTYFTKVKPVSLQCTCISSFSSVLRASIGRVKVKGKWKRV